MLPPKPVGDPGHPGASSRPAEHATATCHRVTVPATPTDPNRPVIAAWAASNALSRSRHGDPAASGTTMSTPARAATRSKNTRAGPSRAVITRSQPRTVAAGTPSVAPIGR